jgi:hypothetical protein
MDYFIGKMYFIFFIKIITTKDVALSFGLGTRTANNICNKLLEVDFSLIFLPK